MRARTRAWLFLLLAGCGKPLPELPRVSTEKFLSAIREPIEKAYRDAQSRPRDPQAVGKLGMLLHAHEQLEAAAACYRRAQILTPRTFSWTYYLGTVEQDLGRSREAEDQFRRALRLDENDLTARRKLADLLLASGQFAESRKLYEAVLQRDEGAAPAWYGLGRVHAALGEWASAEQSLAKACELFPNYGAAHYALAQASRNLGKNAAAEEHLRIYQQHKNDVPPSGDRFMAAVYALTANATDHLRTATELAAAGRLEDAVSEEETALKIDSQLAQAHVNLINLYGRLNQPEQAEQHFRAAIALNPNLADAWYNWGVFTFGQKRLHEARQAFEKALEINPLYAEAHHNLGFLDEQEGRFDRAASEYRKAIENRPDYRLAHFHLGRILAERRRYPEAIEHFRKTLEPADANTPAYLYALGAAYARAGDYASALEYCRRARQSAASFGQTALVASIDRDLEKLERR